MEHIRTYKYFRDSEIKRARKEMVYNFLQALLLFIGIILVIDFMFFTLWILLGQYPQDSFYAGAITVKLISLII